ncbi:olfactory receptor 14A16-like [Ornithorhynchus anatinus]|uniref:Olfactory receptor n=1 Tax=Ornithorhynchus anatinus TaxID=9258 RepID=F6WR58_ORNAN|nr:olfactory receptor 14A16-like [Ornithorhynchus anatinus]
MANCTCVTRFLLLGFSEVRELQLVHAALFLLVYLVALTGNLLIVAVTALDRRLHTPMYFFLRNLSFIDVCYISVTVPKSIFNSLAHRCDIRFPDCVLQVFFFISLASAEMGVLTVMSYDRYAAICRPLLYDAVMSRGACAKMAATSWLSGGFAGLMHTAATFSRTFCGSNMIQQFFCDIPQLVRISHSKGNVAEVGVSLGTISLALACFVSMVVSYVYIISTVLKMPSAEGRSKAFSTCLPHLVVVISFLSTSSFAYLKPTTESPSALDLLLSMFYAVVPPALNPLIYSLRNRDMKSALEKMLGRKLSL